MSAELLSMLDGKRGTSVLLSMNVHGYAFLTLMEPIGLDMSPGGSISYTFAPDEDGLRNARSFVESLQQWIEHIELTEKK